MENEELLYNPRSTSFVGCSMQQSWADLAVWEKFLEQVDAESLIELGTGYCGMSVYLLLQCIQREMDFWTVDIKENSRLNYLLSTFLGLREHFIKSDVFNSTVVEDAVRTLPKPLVLFCDNGDKRKEVKLFVPMLSSGDYVVVHDWPAEINADDIRGFPLAPIMHEECEKWYSYTRFWRIR